MKTLCLILFAAIISLTIQQNSYSQNVSTYVEAVCITDDTILIVFRVTNLAYLPGGGLELFNFDLTGGVLLEYTDAPSGFINHSQALDRKSYFSYGWGYDSNKDDSIHNDAPYIGTEYLYFGIKVLKINKILEIKIKYFGSTNKSEDPCNIYLECVKL